MRLMWMGIFYRGFLTDSDWHIKKPYSSSAETPHIKLRECLKAFDAQRNAHRGGFHRVRCQVYTHIFTDHGRHI